jgi:hypothetical protein
MKHKDLLSLALVGLTVGLASCCNNCNEARIPNDCPCPCTGDVCQGLSCDEIYFANQLVERNRRAFCSKFSAEQRRAAMMASCHTDINCGSGKNAGKKALKPDDAVSAIMRDNNMTMLEKRIDAL